LPFPDFDPVLLQLGPIAIRWYGLAYVGGIVLGWRYMVSLVRKPTLWGPDGAPATALQIDDLILWITFGIILGGRLGHVFFYTPQLIWQNPIEIFQTWKGGMSFHGGTLGVLIGVAMFTTRNKLNVLSIGDLVTSAAPMGLLLGRLANFIKPELWGRTTELPWGIVFPGAGPLPRHPSQLYEAALEGVLLFIVLLFAGRGLKLLKRPGVVSGLFFLGYGLIRIGLENVRQPDEGMPIFPFGLTMGMMLSAPMVLGGAWLIWRGLSKPVAADEPA
jgi:phosphatidylglycerol---prolipoprotein diacylglyceryl transferase